MLHYDAERNIIVTELLPNWSLLGGGTKSLHDLVPQNLASVGQALAVVHRAIAPGTTREVHVPLGVSLYKPSLELYRNSSQGNVQLLAAVHSEGTLRDHLSVLHRSWQHSSFIHGDVKFDNIVSSECDGREISVLVDWEFSGQGDPRWDVGSAVGELLHLWLRDAVSRELGMCAPSENERRGARALEQARLLTTTLLESYYFAAGKPFDGTFPAECFGFAVARLLQTAYEVGQFRSDLDLYAVKAVQVAANIAARRDAVLEIFLDRGARA
jgi:hypothetical protein